MVSIETPAGMELVAEKGYAAMYADMATGNFAVADRRNGQIYTSIPLDAEQDELAYGQYLSTMTSPLVVTDVNETTDVSNIRYAADIISKQNGVKVDKSGNGIAVWYIFNEARYAIPVEYGLCEDGFYARILTNKILEEGDHRICAISLLPFFGARTNDEEGFLLVPDGSGALMRFGSTHHTYSSYVSPVYGDAYLTEQDYVGSVQENCSLPMAGLQARQGGWLAIAEAGAACGELQAMIGGQTTSYNQVNYQFQVRSRQNVRIGDTSSFNAATVTVYQEGNIDVGDIRVRYVLLDSVPQTGLTTMAEVARAYVKLQLNGYEPVAVQNALYLSTVGGFRKDTSVLGWRTEVTQPVTQFTEAASMIEDFRNEGMTDVSLLYTGYDRLTLKGQIGTDITLDRSVGTQQELMALTELLGDNRLFLSLEAVQFTDNNSVVRYQTDAVRDLSLNPRGLKTYKRNTFFANKDKDDIYLLNPSRAAGVLFKLAESLQSVCQRSGISVGNYSHMLYGDYSKDGLSRMKAAYTVQNTLKRIGKNQAVMGDGANYYAAMVCSAVVNVPTSSSQFDILEESVPFYQMVFSGERQLISRPLNTQGDLQTAFLQAVRCGMTPHYEQIVATDDEMKESGLDSYFAANYQSWLPRIKAQYTQWQALYPHIQGKAMVDYQILGPGLSRTIWENGVSVLVNTSDVSCAVDGFTVAADTFVVTGV